MKHLTLTIAIMAAILISLTGCISTVTINGNPFEDGDSVDGDIDGDSVDGDIDGDSEATETPDGDFDTETSIEDTEGDVDEEVDTEDSEGEDTEDTEVDLEIAENEIEEEETISKQDACDFLFTCGAVNIEDLSNCHYTLLNSSTDCIDTIVKQNTCENGVCEEDVCDEIIACQRALEWQSDVTGLNDDPEVLEMTWADAVNHCEIMVVDDHDDWRIPTISELRSLIRECPTNEIDGVCGITDECWEDSEDSECYEGCQSCTKYPNLGDDECFWDLGILYVQEMQGQLVNNCGYFWSATGSDTYKRVMNLNNAAIGVGTVNDDFTFSVRCVREIPIDDTE